MNEDHPSYRLSTQPPPRDSKLPPRWGYHPSARPSERPRAPVVALLARRSSLPVVEARIAEARRLMRGDLFACLLARRECERADDEVWTLIKTLGIPANGTAEALEMARALALWREVDEVAEAVERRVRKARRTLPCTGHGVAAMNDT